MNKLMGSKPSYVQIFLLITLVRNKWVQYTHLFPIIYNDVFNLILKDVESC